MNKLYLSVVLSFILVSCTITTKHDLVPVFKEDGQKVVSSINSLINVKQVGFSGEVEGKGKDSIATMSVRLSGLSGLPEEDSLQYILADKIAVECWKSLRDSTQFKFFKVYFVLDHTGKFAEYSFEIH